MPGQGERCRLGQVSGCAPRSLGPPYEHPLRNCEVHMSPSIKSNGPTFDRRRFLGLSVGTAGALGLSACGWRTGGTESAQGSLTFNMASYGSEEIQPFIKTFERQYGRTMKLSVIPQDYQPTTETRLRAGADYAVVVADEGYPQKWYNEGWIVSLDDVADMDTMRTDMFESLRGASQVDQKTIALPGSGLTKVMVYNEEVLNSAGLEPAETWDEFLDQAKHLKSEGISEYPFVPMWTKAYSLATYFAIGDSYSRGAQEWFDPDTFEPRFDSDPAVLETVRFWRQLWESKLVPRDVLTADHNATTEIFATGKSAYFQHNMSQVLPVLNLDPTAYPAVAGKIKLMLAPGPTRECLTGTNWVCLTPKGADNGGADLLRFLGGLDKNNEYMIPTDYRALALGAEPGYGKVLEDPAVKAKWREFVDIDLFAEQKKRSRLIGNVVTASWYTEWLDRTTAELQSAILGKKSPEDALATSAKFVRGSL